MNNQSPDMVGWANSIKSQLWPELQNILLQLVNNCRITSDEYQWMRQVLSDSNQANRLLDRAIAPFYGRQGIGLNNIGRAGIAWCLVM